MSKPEKLSTATNPVIGWLGLVAMLGSLFFLAQENDLLPVVKTLIVVLCTAFTMISVDVIFFKVHKRTSTGIDWSLNTFNVRRIGIKLAGMFLTVSTVAGIYYLFPEYNRNYYNTVWDTLAYILPYILIIIATYITVIDGVMLKPEDGYFHAGMLMLGKWKKADRSILAAHARSWLIKAFFIPLMFIFLTENMAGLDSRSFLNFLNSPTAFFGFAFMLLYTTDLVFAMVGYVFAIRAIDSHERSSEPTMLGWVVALACYPPMNDFLGRKYTQYGSEDSWEKVLSNHEMGYIVCGIVVIGLTVIYTWATVAFGHRFSNLTHRGIITSGPYRFTKHPAYIAKNLSWWFMYMPFAAMGSPADCIRGCIMLLIMNGVYTLRALTEERHLAKDPAYREYQDWIVRHGIFRWLPFKMHGKNPNPS